MDIPNKVEMTVYFIRFFIAVIFLSAGLVQIFSKEDSYWPPTEKEIKRGHQFGLACLVVATISPFIGEYFLALGVLTAVVVFIVKLRRSIGIAFYD